MKTQHLKAYVKKSDDNIRVVATDESVDREGESIKIDGWSLNNFKKNPMLLWSHNAGLGEQRPAIGKVTKIEQEGKKLTFTPIFDMADSFAAEIARKVKDGFINAVSVGFIPTERDPEDESVIKSAELLEISFVNIPANPNALVILRSAGMPIAKDWNDWSKGIIEEADEKGVIGFSSTTPATIDTSWDGSSARKALKEWAGDSFNKYRRGFAWFDSENIETMGAYKLPHHTVVNGELQVVFRGVAAAMAALMGARGGTDIPEEDRKGVYNHLKKHYDQFDRPAPDFKFVEEQILKDLDVETVTEFVVIEKKELLDRESLKELIKEALPQEEPIKKAVKEMNNKTESTFSSEDLRDSLSMADKALELAFKKMKTLRGGD